jgi:hypothetical protein
MRRYLDILRAMESRERNPQSCGRGAPNDGRTNEINEKRGGVIHLGMWVRWNRVMTGWIVLISEDGWIVVHENKRAGRLVFLRVDGNVQIGRDSASC